MSLIYKNCEVTVFDWYLKGFYAVYMGFVSCTCCPDALIFDFWWNCAAYGSFLAGMMDFHAPPDGYHVHRDIGSSRKRPVHVRC